MNRMKSVTFGLLCCSLVVGGAMSAEPAQTPADKALRDRCHAHYYYTAGVSEDDDEKRMKWFSAAVALAPDLPRAFYNRGGLYAKRGDSARARSDFQEAVRLNPNYIYAHYNLACVNSLDSKLDVALANLESALAAGYRKFDKLAGDPDLKNLQAKPEYVALIAKYQAAAARTEATAYQRLQTADVSEKFGILSESIRAPGPDARALANFALGDGTVELRVLSMHLLRKLDDAQSKADLLLGIYDVNGYVNKAAANSLISYGKDVKELVASTLDDKETPAPFFAMQILASIGARDTIDKITPYLLDGDDDLRIVAAKSLAELGDLSVLPQLEAAAKKLPDDEKSRDFYVLEMRIAIELLKKSGKKK